LVVECHPVCKPTVGQAMYGAGNKAGVRISQTPPDKRAGRVRQPSTAQRSEEKAGEA